MVDPSSPSNQLVGAVLNGRFKLVRLLGEGGMGAVFEADSLRGEGKRAVKLLHPEYINEPQVLSRFFAEAEAAQALQHPNIARVFEAARAEDGTPYIVMELLQGMPLAAFVSKLEPMAMRHAAPIIHEVLQALALAHARHIVHRDLKPDNIFLVRDERGGFNAKVLDFGIAKVMDVVGGMGSKTRTGALLGTPGYMSPEQIKNSKAVDARSDLWSVGSMFYELVTGAEAFPADNDFARLTVTITSEARPIEEVAPHLAAWGQFFRRALAKDPADRFQTAEEMDRSLMLLASGGPQVPEWSSAPTPRAAPPAGPISEAPAGVAHPALGAFAQNTGVPAPAANASHIS
ncbi:MAG: serine/threonine protein kinase, partial [Polyangiaceae bacterium]|nr:serine/threonine protein kinase [Polyangiaceae bacterium]